MPYMSERDYPVADSLTAKQVEDYLHGLKQELADVKEHRRNLHESVWPEDYDFIADHHEVFLIAAADHPDIRKAMRPHHLKEAEALRAERGLRAGEMLAAMRRGVKRLDLLHLAPNPRARTPHKTVKPSKPSQVDKDRANIVGVKRAWDVVEAVDETSTDGGITWKQQGLPYKFKDNFRKVVRFGDGTVEEFNERALNEMIFVMLAVCVGVGYFAPPFFGASWAVGWNIAWWVVCGIVWVIFAGGAQDRDIAPYVATIYGFLRGAVLGMPIAAIVVSGHEGQPNGGLPGLAVMFVVGILSMLHFRHHVARRAQLLDGLEKERK